MNFTKQGAFTFHKLLYLCKLLICHLISKRIKRVIGYFYPISISIEPTNTCNLQCPECPTGNASLTRNRQNMPWKNFQKTIDEISPSLWSITLYFQGEPFLHPNFLDMILYCHDKRLFTYTSTNGQLITDKIARRIIESGLDKIIISVDGLTQTVYEQYRRGGDLVKAIEAIRLLAQWKKELNSKTPIIEAQFIVMKHNEFQIPDFKTTAKDWGADKAVLKTAQIDLDRVESLMPNQIRYSRYAKQTNGTWQLKKRLKNSCWRQWSGAVIAVNGDVLPCCFDKNGDHVFGNLHENSFNDIWNGEKATAFRQAILSDRKQFAICRNCTE